MKQELSILGFTELRINQDMNYKEFPVLKQRFLDKNSHYLQISYLHNQNVLIRNTSLVFTLCNTICLIHVYLIISIATFRLSSHNFSY